MIQTGIELVDEAKADLFLSKNYKHNRPMTMSHARYFASKQANGEFLQGTNIRFVRENGEEYLVDGQHRCMAVKLSKIPATFSVTVVDGNAAREYALVDSVIKRRTSQDQLRALGTMADVELPTAVINRYIGALRIIESNFTIPYERASDMTLDQMGDMSEEFRDEMTRFLQITSDANYREVQNALKSTVLAVALVTLKYADPTASESFWKQVVLDDGLNIGDPRKRLHHEITQMTGNSRSIRRNTLLTTIACWNLYATGNSMPKRLFLPKTAPQIAETPYPLEDEPVQPELIAA